MDESRLFIIKAQVKEPEEGIISQFTRGNFITKRLNLQKTLELPFVKGVILSKVNSIFQKQHITIRISELAVEKGENNMLNLKVSLAPINYKEFVKGIFPRLKNVDNPVLNDAFEGGLTEEMTLSILDNLPDSLKDVIVASVINHYGESITKILLNKYEIALTVKSIEMSVR